MPNYRLLALDLDGTLLTEEKSVSDNTRYWVRRAMEAGVTVIFATGRGLQRIEHLWQGLDLKKSPMVLLNGAEVWNRYDELRCRHFIDPKDIVEIHRLAENKQAGFWAYSVDGMIQDHNWDKSMFDHNLMKFGIRHQNSAMIPKLKGLLEGWSGLEVVKSGPRSLEISREGITKASGVKEVCKLLGIRMKQVMAIGDSPNDLSLLQEAGLGVAMGNAAGEVKRIANQHTDSNKREGVAKAIQKYLLN